MNKTKIEWCDYVHNPFWGCTPISPGCDNCYARKIANRFMQGRVSQSRIIYRSPKIFPEDVKRPQRVFIESMGDLFHGLISDAEILAVQERMKRAPQHTYFILTKRPERMRTFSEKYPWGKNVWLGVSVENLEYIWRIDTLRQTQASHRFVSFEPLLGQIYPIIPGLKGLDWIIIGPETGSQRRQCDESWIAGLILEVGRHCLPVFVKAFPLDGKISKNPDEWPAWARRREQP